LERRFLNAGRFSKSDDTLNAVLDRWFDKAVNKEYDRVKDKKKASKYREFHFR